MSNSEVCSEHGLITDLPSTLSSILDCRTRVDSENNVGIDRKQLEVFFLN